MNEVRWYVVHANSRREGIVRDGIERLGREAFLPLVERRPRPRAQRRIEPLFPGYLFARLSVEAGDLAAVRWSHGVRRILGDGEGPRPVDDGVVEVIRRRADGRGRVRQRNRPRRGDRVRILDGPLAGIIGVLDRPAVGSEARVGVLLELFRRPTLVSIDLESIDRTER